MWAEILKNYFFPCVDSTIISYNEQLSKKKGNLNIKKLSAYELQQKQK